MDKGRRYCDVKMASEYTGIPIKTLYDWASQGRIPSIKIYGKLMFEFDELNKFMQSHRRMLVVSE